MAKRVIGIILTLVMIMALSACGAKKTVIDYGDAESFEAALNAGENLEGKVVQFVAGEFHPDSALGYNIWAGEHLNFISSRNPDIKEGDTAVVRATTIESSMGSWIISYEKVDNAEIGDTTITSAKGSGINGASDESASTETSGESSGSDTLGSLAKDDAAESSGSGTQSFATDNSSNEEKPLELKDYGWFANDPYDSTAYVEFVGMIYNPNDKLVAHFPKLEVTVKNGDGTIVATEEQVGSLIMPGDTVTLCGMFSMSTSDLTDDAQITFDVDCSDFDTGTSIYSAAKTTDFEFANVSERKGDDYYITGEITNNYSEDVDSVNLALILRKDGKIVYIENTFLDGLKSGKTKAFEFQRYSAYPDHDTIDVSAMVW